MRAADVQQGAILQALRRKVIELATLEQLRQLTRLSIELLNAERAKRQKMSLAIPANTSGLKHDLSPFTRPPSRRGVERVAFRQFLNTTLPADFDADVRRAVLVQNAKYHVPAFARHGDVPDLCPIIIPEPAFFRAELPDFKQRAQVPAFQRI